MPLHATWGSPSSFACDCSCATRGLADRHPTVTSFADALLKELRHISESDEPCSACATIEHFRTIVRSRKSAAHALRRVAHAHAAEHGPCDHYSCVGLHAWRVVRVSTLATDLADLSACDSESARSERELMRRCAAEDAPFAHFQLYHAAVKHPKTYNGPHFWGLALDEPRQSSCDLSLNSLAPSLKRYHSGVLGESAGAMALGFGASCLRLPKWVSLASHKQDEKGYPLPCANLTAIPFDSVNASSPTALVYSQWTKTYPHQTILPSWSALLHEELGIEFSSSELSHVPRIGVSATHSAAFIEAKMPSPFAGASHPCCSYMIVPRESVRALGKLHALLLMRVYLQKRVVMTANDTKPWWETRAFLWAKHNWAEADESRGCWGFEGRPLNRTENKHTSVPRNEGALSYLGEGITILFLYLTHTLVSLGGGRLAEDGTVLKMSQRRSEYNRSVEEIKAECATRVERPAVHGYFHGRTNLEAIEAAYDRLAERYRL